ncbi:hypothetical protein [Schnuerera sp.]|uniref:hypothetical protein n=1 Tax=Schnuerera sp. TaxID=2794844 RepID=UPI002B8A3DE6|nr:hypothetical protein [Schnuerera sp.]HSH35682.1 hypothetical protein [Schnuerera sp.]
MKKARIFITFFVVLFILFFILEIGYSNDNFNADHNVYIVVANKLTLSDIDKMSNFKMLIEDGNFGLMNVRGISSYRGAGSFATINASNKTSANNESSQFHNLDNKLKEIYENRAGKLDKEYEIANMQIGRLHNQNENNRYSPFIGALGHMLHKGGHKTAVYGNSDTDMQFIRTSALIPMDSKGLIDYGNIDDILIEDLDYPYGIKTDYDKILDEIWDIKSKASLIVVDTGDLNRLNSYNNFLSDDKLHQKRNMILQDIDTFIGDLVNIIGKDKSLLMIFSPNSGEERIDGNRLSPILIWGKGVEKGIPISATTKRPGVISNLDISPTVLNFLNLSIENMGGNNINYIEKYNSFKYIESINGRINLMSRVRGKTLLLYGTASIVIMLMASVIFLFKIKLNNNLREWMQVLLLLLYGLPMIFIINSLFKIDTLFKFVASLVIILGLFTYIFKKTNVKSLIFFITYSYFIIIAVDILFNGIFTKYSIISHDPIIGARYFGIGNEMVGLFLVATTLTAGLLHQKSNKKSRTILVLFMAIFTVGHPKLGANVGGTIALLSATIFFILELMNKELNLKNMTLTLVIVIITIGILGYIDIKFNPSPTHLGSTLLSINNTGIGLMKNIIDRKLLMNIRLVGISFWTKVIIINVFIQIMVSYLFKDRINNFMNTGLGKGYLACIIGSIVGFLVNDSGLILSGITVNMMTIFLIFIILYNKEIYTK